MRLAHRIALHAAGLWTLAMVMAPLTIVVYASSFITLYSFTGRADGAMPEGDLVRDAAGNLYGTTTFGGSGTSNGVVFKLLTTGNEKVLWTFTGGADGGSPQAGLVRDSAGNLYGTTYSGGSGSGVIFKVGPTGGETVLHAFTKLDGSHSTASLVRDSGGNFYGTTFYGGTATCSCGTVFKLSASGTETVLYSFTGQADGKFPHGGLIRDSAGNLYGTASEGGVVSCDNLTDGCGVIFKIDTTGKESVLYSFTGADGGQPLAGLIRDSAGNFYGTTFMGGDVTRPCALNHGCGVVFKLTKATGQESVLYTFHNGPDGANPQGGLVMDALGNLYGTTKLGSHGYGVVFKLNPAGTESALYSFTGTSDGADPMAGLLRDSAGNLYGTASGGGASLAGDVFKVGP